MKTLVTALFLTLVSVSLCQAQLSKDIVSTWSVSFENEGQPMTAQVTFKADNTFAYDIMADGEIEVEGTYEISGDKVMMKETSTTFDSNCGDAVMTMQMKVEGNSLTVTPISDECEERRNEDNSPVTMSRV